MRPVAVVLGTWILATSCGTGGQRAGAATPDRFGFGREATTAEVDAWDIDVAPDGTGLPAGSGTARSGSAVYARQCAACHGRSGTEGPMDRLVRSEEHTSELQSHHDLVCRLLLEKKKQCHTKACGAVVSHLTRLKAQRLRAF